MCGIAGIWGQKRPGDEAIVQGLLQEIAYRGPDDLQILSISAPLSDRGATLGAVRLAIVDPEKGRQPVVVKDGSIGLVMNGEAYNYKALNRSLAEQGHHFNSDCDTETVARLYAQYGASFPLKVRGMFAALAYNAQKDELIAARDPFGIKPLYYVTDALGRTLFCSEIRPLQNLAATPGDVQVIGPGRVWVNGKCERHYQPQISAPPSHEAVREMFMEAVDLHLPPEGDRPTIIFLSGGLDSGLIASVAAQKRKNIIALTASTEEGGSDAQPAHHLAEQLGIRCETVIMKPQEMVGALPNVIRHLENYDYFQVLCALPYWFLSKRAKELGAKVVLSGEGSDELFAGYGFYHEWVERCAPYLRNPTFSDAQNKWAVLEMGTRTSLAEFLCSSELQRGDRMTAAFGLEMRVPFLDALFANMALSLPVQEKAPYAYEGDARNKWFLREAFRGFVPDCVVSSPKAPLHLSSGAGENTGKASFLALAEQAWAARSKGQSVKTVLGLQYKVEEYFLALWRESHPAFAQHLEQTAISGQRINPSLCFRGFYIDPAAADAFGLLATRDGIVAPNFVESFSSLPSPERIPHGWSSASRPTSPRRPTAGGDAPQGPG